MSFVSNSENIWEFLGTEKYWQDLGLKEGDEILYDLINKDQFEIEKMKLKKDAELLNQMIIVSEDGKVFARKDLIHLASKKHHQYKAGEQNYTTSGEEGDEEEISILSGDYY